MSAVTAVNWPTKSHSAVSASEIVGVIDNARAKEKRLATKMICFDRSPVRQRHDVELDVIRVFLHVWVCGCVAV